MGNYVLILLQSLKKTEFPKTPEVSMVDFILKIQMCQPQYPTVVIAVDDIQKAMDDIKDAGGKLIGEQLEIPGYGLYLSFFDTEG